MIKIKWLSGAGFRIEDSKGNVTFIDAWLDAAPGNPGHPFKVTDITRAALVLVTHGDPGHYGRGDGVRIASQNNCVFASSAELCGYVIASGLLPESNVRTLGMQQETEVGGVMVQMFPAVHPPWTPPADYLIPREPNTGFLLKFDGVSVLFVGDVVAGDAIWQDLRKSDAEPVVGLLPIGSPAGSHGTLESTAQIVAEIADATGLKYVIPHYNYVPSNPTLGVLDGVLHRVGSKLVALEPGSEAQFTAQGLVQEL